MIAWPGSAFVGQKVTLTHHVPEWKVVDSHHKPENTPEFGKVYTIREIRVCAQHKGQVIGFLFKEFTNGPDPQGYEPAFGGYLFRPVIDKKTDISIFNKALTPHKKQIKTPETIGYQEAFEEFLKFCYSEMER